MSRSIVGVDVWLRTNSRAWSVRRSFQDTESHRISALVPKSVNQSGGSGLRMAGAPAYDGAAEVDATARPPATVPAWRSERRESLVTNSQ